MIIHILFTYLIRPDALSSPKPPNTSAHFHILMSGVHFPQTFTYVWHHSPENFATEDHSRPSHAEVLSWLKTQFSKLFNVSQSSLPQIKRFTAVQ